MTETTTNHNYRLKKKHQQVITF